jgi:DNA primase
MPKEKKPFVDFRDIRSRITMEQVLSHYNLLDTFKRSGHSLSGPCPIHKGTNKTQFRVDTERNIWNCFSECKHGGNVLDFIARMENLPIHDAAIKACEWFSILVEEVEASDNNEPRPSNNSRTPAAKAEIKTPDAKPEDNTPNSPLKFKLDKLQREHPYLVQERGLTLETIIDFGLGFFTGNKGMMVGHVVIPIHNAKGEIVAYAGRWPGEPPNKETPKYKLPPGFKKAQELYNLDRAIKETVDGPLVIVEGFFDAIKLHQHGYRKVVALMGTSLSVFQEQLIRQHIPSNGHIIVMLDENAAGQAGRADIVARLSRHCYVRVHVFDKLDMEPEHLTADEVKGLLP